MTRKPKELPDLRPRVHPAPEGPDEAGRPWSPPSAEKVQELANRHGIGQQIDLATELDGLWFWWRIGVQSGPPPAASVRRKFLQELATRAESLSDAVGKVGSMELGLILDVVPSKRLDLESLTRDLRYLALAATVAARRVSPSASGARGDQDINELLRKLWRLYLRAFGPNARRLTRSGDRYSGKFFNFANDVLLLFGVRKSNQGLGKAIEKAQAAVAARGAKSSIP